MCTKHSMPRRNSNMELIQTPILQPIWSTTKKCVQKQVSNDKWLITSTRIFYKTSSPSLDCINELSSAIDSTIAIVHKNFTLQHQIETLKFGRMQHVKFITWSKWKIRKPQQYEVTATTLPQKILWLLLLGLIVFIGILHSNRFTLVNLTTSSKFETRRLYSIISQLHHIITAKQLAAANWLSSRPTSNNDNFTVLNQTCIIIKKSISQLL